MRFTSVTVGVLSLLSLACGQAFEAEDGTNDDGSWFGPAEEASAEVIYFEGAPRRPGEDASARPPNPSSSPEPAPPPDTDEPSAEQAPSAAAEEPTPASEPTAAEPTAAEPRDHAQGDERCRARRGSQAAEHMSHGNAPAWLDLEGVCAVGLGGGPPRGKGKR